MSFAKVTLSLIMICSVVQASTLKQRSNLLQKEASREQVNNRGGCCSSVKRTLFAATVFSAVLLGGVNADPDLQAYVQSLPEGLSNCVSRCKKSDSACYDECAQELFPNPYPMSFGRSALNWYYHGYNRIDKNYREDLSYKYKSCKKHLCKWQKDIDECVHLSNEECLEAVVEHAVNDENYNSAFDPKGAVWGKNQRGFLDSLRVLFFLAAGV